MVERTKRGEEDRRREDDEMQGEPAGTTAGAAGTQGANTTRDKSVEPAADRQRDGRGQSDES